MDKIDYLTKEQSDFQVEIQGLRFAHEDLEELKKKWFMNSRKILTKKYLELLIPRLEGLKMKFEQELNLIISYTIMEASKNEK